MFKRPDSGPKGSKLPTYFGRHLNQAVSGVVLNCFGPFYSSFVSKSSSSTLTASKGYETLKKSDPISVFLRNQSKINKYLKNDKFTGTSQRKKEPSSLEIAAITYAL